MTLINLNPKFESKINIKREEKILIRIKILFFLNGHTLRGRHGPPDSRGFGNEPEFGRLRTGFDLSRGFYKIMIY